MSEIVNSSGAIRVLVAVEEYPFFPPRFLFSYLFFFFFLLHSGIPSLSSAKHPRLFPRRPLYGMATHQAPRGSCALSWPPSLPHAGLRACGETCEKLGKTAIIILILTVAPENGLRGWLVRAF